MRSRDSVIFWDSILTATFFPPMPASATQAVSKLLPSSCARIFRHKVLKLLLSERKITEDLVRMLMSWRHSGFNVFSGPQIYPREGAAMDNLARYVIRASLSQKRTSCWRSTERGVKTQGEKWPRLHLFLLRLISPFIVINHTRRDSPPSLPFIFPTLLWPPTDPQDRGVVSIL